MIVWGGWAFAFYNTGGKYNPVTDSWTATSTADAPNARFRHTAVWTGSEMIVWGGEGNAIQLSTGGRYNPATDSWTATSRTNTPAARRPPTPPCTANHLIVWGV